VSVDGAGNNYGDPADGEVELDIEVTGSIAPGATIAVYFAPNTEQGFIDAISAPTFDTTNNPTIISISWGAPEDAGWTAAGLSGMDSALATAAAFGITVRAASGDNGSNDNVYDGVAHCDFPASDPYVLACESRGTTRDWDGPPVVASVIASAWQAGKGVPPCINDGVSLGRGVPDVSADADPHTGYKIVVDGAWMVTGGTSAAAPSTLACSLL
jgi:kumamolisin